MITNKNFADWHNDVFGYGYGSGEEYWIPSLHRLLTELLVNRRNYESLTLEGAFGGLGAWLLINALCGAEIFEYGTSPRYGWLTERGELLREYAAAHSAEQLEEIATEIRENSCMRDWCNCTSTASTCNPLFRR